MRDCELLREEVKWYGLAVDSKTLDEYSDCSTPEVDHLLLMYCEGADDTTEVESRYKNVLTLTPVLYHSLVTIGVLFITCSREEGNKIQKLLASSDQCIVLKGGSPQRRVLWAKWEYRSVDNLSSTLRLTRTYSKKLG